jgi:hypothetical protein
MSPDPTDITGTIASIVRQFPRLGCLRTDVILDVPDYDTVLEPVITPEQLRSLLEDLPVKSYLYSLERLFQAKAKLGEERRLYAIVAGGRAMGFIFTDAYFNPPVGWICDPSPDHDVFFDECLGVLSAQSKERSVLLELV